VVESHNQFARADGGDRYPRDSRHFDIPFGGITTVVCDHPRRARSALIVFDATAHTALAGAPPTMSVFRFHG
jgi:hypothetical protein